MTREEIVNSMSLQDAIKVFKDTNTYGTMDIAKTVILKALEQEPCDYYDADNKTCRKSEVPKEPCEDAISRQAIIDMTGLSEWFDSSDSYNEFVIALSELPSVTPQPKMGHWISHSEHCKMNNLRPSGLASYWWCSECDYGIDYKYFHTVDFKHCPNCGAEMESED